MWSSVVVRSRAYTTLATRRAAGGGRYVDCVVDDDWHYQQTGAIYIGNVLFTIVLVRYV